ncbi:hypothetical protein [Halomicrobium salinisoli]|uniref:hypothetical protein n=1 Tax=Halomicrobium salinisoli TaxID=2878391 RepID=UPI001CF09AA5|nr:hypothetical protein [Halomicrobium salinisoli]
MSIEISDALKGGFRRFASRTGAVLALGYLLAFSVYMIGYFGLLAGAYARLDVGVPTPGPVPDLPIAAAAAVVLGGLLTMTYLSVVAIRTFVAGSRSSFPAGALSRNVPFAVGNMIAGGIALMLLTGALVAVPVAVAAVALDGLASGLVGLVLGLAAAVVALYLTVALIFMPMYVAAEGTSFVAGLRRSWALTRGERLSVFLLYLVLVVLVFGASIPLGILSFVAALAGAGMIVAQLLNVVLIAPFTMFQLAVFSVAFQQLRAGGASDSGGAAPADASGTPA